jgi:Ala-tRNA(Pro) deacylase
MTIASTLQSYLDGQGADYDLVQHPKTYSTHDTAQAAHIPGDHIAKAVLVKDTLGCVMAVIPGNSWLKLEAMGEELNRDFQLAEEQETDALFPGCEPGAIPPIGPAYGIETVLDEALTTLANVYFEAGDHEQLVHVTGETFRALLPGVRHGHFSHER